MANLITKIDAIVLKVEKSALVLTSAAITSATLIDPSRLPHKWAVIALVVNNALMVIKPKLQKAIDVTQNLNGTVVTSFVDKAENVVKHVVSEAKVVPKTAVAEYQVLKDQVTSAPAAQVAADQATETKDAAQLQADAAAALKVYQAAAAAAEALPPVPAGA
jgi:hypothetical protein